jgi:diadenosine tetraphosphate (Ap4A) HIT family hydrolase
MSCFICDKHAGITQQPPGGYIYEDEHWMVCHFSPRNAVLGQVVVESKRHFLDFSDMTDDEAKSYGVLVWE